MYSPDDFELSLSGHTDPHAQFIRANKTPYSANPAT